MSLERRVPEGSVEEAISALDDFLQNGRYNYVEVCRLFKEVAIRESRDSDSFDRLSQLAYRIATFIFEKAPYNTPGTEERINKFVDLSDKFSFASKTLKPNFNMQDLF